MIEIVDCEQGSPEWFKARMGIPTASEFKTIVGLKKDARDKITRATYMRKLAGEILTGQPMESYSNGYMERGKELEDEARSLYGFMNNIDPIRVGFIRSGQTGCSPDSLLGDKGGLEIKVALPHIQIERIERDELPSEHRFQVQGNLWITGREWWDFVSYCPGLPLFTKRIFRDQSCIDAITRAVDAFNNELAVLVELVRSYERRAA